jgi:hypothetical protein
MYGFSEFMKVPAKFSKRSSQKTFLRNLIRPIYVTGDR